VRDRSSPPTLKVASSEQHYPRPRSQSDQYAGYVENIWDVQDDLQKLVRQTWKRTYGYHPGRGDPRGDGRVDIEEMTDCASATGRLGWRCTYTVKEIY